MNKDNLKIVGETPPSNGSAKFFLQTRDTFTIETAHINHPAKHIICAATQIGCKIGCKFCASGLANRYQRSLTTAELVGQCQVVSQKINLAPYDRPLVFSFMGEGEMCWNRETFTSCTMAFHELSGMSWEVPIRIAASTSGIRPDFIEELGNMDFKVPWKLQVSLHGTTEEVRRSIVPNTNKLERIIAASRLHRERCARFSGRKIEFNYVLCHGVNDSEEQARLLVELAGPGWRVKLNHLNPVDGSMLKISSQSSVERFRHILEEGGVQTVLYETGGSEIGAACGQLEHK